MADGSSLHRFGSHKANEFQVADIIFVHGLGGDVTETWSVSGTDDGWPAWLASELPCVQVSSVSYDAAATKWVSRPMPLQDRGTNILTLLEAEGIGARPIVFICHSLGGLVVKQMLRIAQDTKKTEWKNIRERTRSIFFLATPHAGSPIVFMTKLLKLLRVSSLTEQLGADDPYLHDLNNWYTNNSEGVATHTFYETKKTYGTQIVDRGSANIGMQGVTSVPLDADHRQPNLDQPH
jgi:triacylglycerol esterase/lipase EstA (alpha/beta hydrolase family)